MTEIKIKRLEERARQAFNEESPAERMEREKYIHPVLNELPKEDMEEMAFFDTDGNKVRVYAEQGLIDDMQRHSSCDFVQDSIKDSKESRPKQAAPLVNGYDPDEVRQCREAVNKETPNSGIDGVRESRVNITKENSKNVPVKVFENSRKMAEEIDKHRCDCQNVVEDPFENMYKAQKALDDAAKKILGVDNIPEDLSNFYTKKNRPMEDWAEATKEPVTKAIEKQADPVLTEGGEFPKYEFVNHPQHYNNYDMEVIDMMTRLFGVHETISFCKLNAFKYRMRAGTKPGESAEQDIRKEQWYLDKAKDLEEHLF